MSLFCAFFVFFFTEIVIAMGPKSAAKAHSKKRMLSLETKLEIVKKYEGL